MHKPNLQDVKDYYKILGISKTASSYDIRKAYHLKIREFHPDRYPDDEKKLKKFRELVEAYEVLGNLENRLKYSLLLNFKARVDKSGNIRYVMRN